MFTRSDLTIDERKEYTKAVLCLQSKPPKTSAPGAKSRFDDYVAVHIQMTPQVHGSVCTVQVEIDPSTTGLTSPDKFPALAPLLRMALRERAS